MNSIIGVFFGNHRKTLTGLIADFAIPHGFSKYMTPTNPNNACNIRRNPAPVEVGSLSHYLQGLTLSEPSTEEPGRTPKMPIWENVMHFFFGVSNVKLDATNADP